MIGRLPGCIKGCGGIWDCCNGNISGDDGTRRRTVGGKFIFTKNECTIGAKKDTIL